MECNPEDMTPLQEEFYTKHKAAKGASNIAVVGYFYFMWVFVFGDSAYPDRVFYSGMVMLGVASVFNFYSFKCKERLILLLKEEK